MCFLAILADGYDLGIYGATLPTLLKGSGWDMGPALAGAIGSYTLVGMMVGYLLAGPITDRVGRRPILVAGIAWFSVGSGICALATGPGFFGAARFFTGIGLGLVVPSAIALGVEFAPRGRHQIYNGLLLTGYAVGGVGAALAGLFLVPHLGWRGPYWVGAAFLLAVPVVAALVPESVGHLTARGRLAEAGKIAARYGLYQPEAVAADKRASRSWVAGLRDVFQRRYRRATVLFFIASACGTLLLYGLNTWLPQLMREAGYPLGSSLEFLLLYQAGSVAGLIAGALLADRVGPKPVVVPYFLVAVVCLLLLAQPLGVPVLMMAVILTGLGTSATQSLIDGYIAVYYPASSRASALGVTLGFGRVGAIAGPSIAGWVLAAGVGFQWNFYAFAIPALVGAIAISAMPRRRATDQLADDGISTAVINPGVTR